MPVSGWATSIWTACLDAIIGPRTLPTSSWWAGCSRYEPRSSGRSHQGRYPKVSVPLSQPQVRPKVIADQAVHFLAESGQLLAEVSHVLWRDAFLPAKIREVQDHVPSCVLRPVLTWLSEPPPDRFNDSVYRGNGRVFQGVGRRQRDVGRRDAPDG